MKRMLFLILVGLGGATILVSLGVWQVQRLAWKQGVIADIEARIVDAPVTLPQAPDPEVDAYLPVEVTGSLSADHLRVLVSQNDLGAGYRIISVMDHQDGGILIDRGYVRVADYNATDMIGDVQSVTILGNLQWPDETDAFTPEPDRDANIWYARDVDAMAEALGSRPILVVAREVSPGGRMVSPFPVDTSRIPNNHLQYAITWFSLAAVWLAMSLLFLRRRRGQMLES